MGASRRPQTQPNRTLLKHLASVRTKASKEMFGAGRARASAAVALDSGSSSGALSEPSRTPRIKTCVLFLVAASLLPACTTRVQEEAVDVADFGPTLSELLRIGAESTGDTILFGAVRNLIAIEGTGRILVGDLYDSRVYAFEADGSLLGTIGRQGGGPGEFERIESIYSGPGDTLFVFDSELDRISAFEPGTFALAYDFTVSQDSLGQPLELVGVRDTDFLMTFGQPPRSIDADRDRRKYVVRVSWKGEAMPPTMHDLPAGGFTTSLFAMDGLPFGRHPVYRLGPGNELFAGWTASVDIEVREPDGALSHVIAYPRDPIPMTRREIEWFVEGMSDMVREAFLGADLPEFKQAYETFVVDDSARIWLKVTPPSMADTSAQWLILNSRSQLGGQVTLPANTDLQVIREGRAYAVTQGREPVIIVYEIRQ